MFESKKVILESVFLDESISKYRFSLLISQIAKVSQTLAVTMYHDFIHCFYGMPLVCIPSDK